MQLQGGDAPVPGLPAALAAGTGVQLFFTVAGVERVNRLIRVPVSLPLSILHEIIQTALGWRDDGLHAFLDDDGGHRFTASSDLPRFAAEGDEQVSGTEAVAVGDVLPGTGDVISYAYYPSAGGSWLVHLAAVGTEPMPDGAGQVELIADEGMGPFEELGSAAAWRGFLEARLDEDHPHHGEAVELYNAHVGRPGPPSARQ